MLRQISHDGCESGVFTDSTYHNLQPLVPCFENNFNHHFSSFEFFPTHFIRQSYQVANKMWLSISVRLWVPQSFSFPGPLNVTAKRKRQNASGKGPLSIINYLLIFSARSQENWSSIKEVNQFICFHANFPAVILQGRKLSLLFSYRPSLSLRIRFERAETSLGRAKTGQEIMYLPYHSQYLSDNSSYCL